MNTQKEALIEPDLIEFATVAVDFASMLEQAKSFSPDVFIDRCTKVLPLLYLKTAQLVGDAEEPDIDDYVEEYISETAYMNVQQAIETLLGEYDAFLSTNDADMPYSDTPIHTSIAECLADVYQQVGNLLGILKENNLLALPAALWRCIYYFGEYWGARLLAALAALHSLRHGEAYTKLCQAGDAGSSLATQEELADESLNNFDEC